MKEELAKAYDPKETEGKIYRLWEEGGGFQPRTKNSEQRTYAIHLPPPNITGSLHMGHALNATIADILIRYHRMKGDKTVWFPGTDHAGIATQNVVEKQLKKEGMSRWDLGREKFIEKVWEWKNKYGNIIIEQLKKLGASADWSRLRFTMDENYANWVKKAFIHYYEKGLIYRGKRIVSWCVACQTSLSDLEVEYKEESGKLWFIKYPIVAPTPRGRSDNYVIVATTRPETMLGDVAVAVNPKDKRYKNLIGKKILLPLQNREIPIIADDKIDMIFGTGAVKVTPAHDLLDAEIGERHKLEPIDIIDERGRMTAAAGEKFKGLKVAEAREKVVRELEEAGLLEKIEDYKHNVAICYRSGTVLEPLRSNQWFLRMVDHPQNPKSIRQSADKNQKLGTSLRDAVLNAVKSGKVKIIPENFEKILFSWLENIHDWCISRQIWWGHQLPVWFHEPKCIPKKGHESDVVKCKEMVVAVEKPQCEFCDAEFKQSEDVLDTWFSSALWPFAGLSEADLKDFYPSNVLITARDIINLWVGRMIFSGLEFQKAMPFPEVLIHATILTKEGKRMSKSLGTGIDPLGLIEKYGADATRFGIIWQTMGTQDIHWDEAAVQAGKKFANKLWNIARFSLMKIENSKFKIQKLKLQVKIQNNEDRKILQKLDEVKKIVEKNINSYEFGPALHALYDFIWHDFADKYIELVKDRQDEEADLVLQHALFSILKMLHPFMPFITESIYQKIGLEKKDLLMIESWVD
ncbi:MAG: valine--tRNA ligase [Candidatus Harrisonbacteria bacterium RIFCSPLOWO2_02_FULL_41_13b]|uniref:Valine--tRNA ligase n=1 Tax=Candidatus Harrisonbacteria bacterium RIFCSPLOWO2_02_FULL_41_13b TaxID=1798409 RepID=A0A1G1ZQQ3_9BACT|nr:MAG: valine--tRNA ligase [Candidatus Harrisonbacteria bacterium RIFCSPHIGHO2_02_FULL_40_20]OGY66954.1 MAG: valine--tRNA ligase [Candidatus Harrisonbacteria bacterium RIFCSPLOWO2_02_FULL_41_13b]